MEKNPDGAIWETKPTVQLSEETNHVCSTWFSKNLSGATFVE